MSADQKNASTTTARFAACWRVMRDTFYHANRATRCVLAITFKLLVVGYFLFCALFLMLRYVILPEVDHYKPEIEQIASRAVGRPVTMAAIATSWSGLRPQLALTDVVIHDQAGQPALSLPHVSATLSWSTLLVGNLRFENLTIDNPDLAIQRNAAGKLFVAGLAVDNGGHSGAGADWVLSQREIVIRNGKIRWRDDLRKAPELALNDVTLVLHNNWRKHQFALKATPPAAFAAPVDIRASFYHPSFASSISDVSRWKGTLYTDLRDTDLSVWKAYFDYPIDIAQGRGSVRAWLDLDHAKVANFTADLHLSDLSARLGKGLEPLQLKQVNGRVSASEAMGATPQDGVPTFGANGHAVTLTDFSLQTDDGFLLPATTISERFEPATKLQQEKMRVQARFLDLETLSSLAARLPLTASQRQLLSDLAPRGQLKDFSVQWQGSYPDVAAYQIRGSFTGLGMKAQARRPAQDKLHAAAPAIPGFANLSGQIDANEKGGTLGLATTDAVFRLSAYFSDPDIAVDKLNMNARWTFQKDQQLLFQIENMDFAQDGLAGSLSGTHLIPLQGKSVGAIDMKGRLNVLDFKKVGRYLPAQTPVLVRDWVSNALVNGQLHDADVVLKGDLADFPFQPLKPGDKPRGEFSLNGKFDGLTMNYSPSHFALDGKSPEWPLLQEAKGTLAINRSRLEIKAESGKTHGVAVKDVSAVIPDLLAHESVLEIEGSAAGAMQDFLQYVSDSPVAHWIGNFTEVTKATGNGKLQLKFQLPLHHMIDAKVDGNLQFLNNDVMLLNGLPTIYKTSGKLEFDQKGFNLNGLKGQFLGEWANIAGGTQRDGSTLVKVDGGMSAEGLRKNYSEPVLQRLLEKLSGSTRYNATISVKGHQPEIIVESGLQGLALNLPAPLGKTASENLPLKFELLGLASDDPLVERDELKLSLGSVLAARYQRQKAPGRQADWRVTRGGIGIEQPAPLPDSGLMVAVNAKTANVDEWVSFRSAVVGEADSSEGGAASGLNAYLEPDALTVRATDLIVMGKKLNNVVFGASHQRRTWQVNIDSAQISGYATWNEPNRGRGLGKVTARLAALNIPQSAAADVGDILEGNGTTTQIPALDIVAEDFQLFGKKLGRLELNANNVGVSVGREWRINRLSLVNPDAEFKAAGNWMAFGNSNTSNLTYALDITDAGKLLDRFGFPGVVKGGKGKLDGDVSWRGLPFSMDIPTLSGQIHMDIHNGQFLKVDPGAAKLLGVLNLQALPRRLMFDFRDVFSEGFAFDNIVGTASVSQGIASTDNLKMSGVTASVLMNGSADIARESQNLHLVVIPEFNLGTASVVALAINPVVGVGTFLAQLFLRNPLMKSLTFEYNVTGSWSDPVVVKQEHSGTDAGVQDNGKSDK